MSGKAVWGMALVGAGVCEGLERRTHWCATLPGAAFMPYYVEHPIIEEAIVRRVDLGTDFAGGTQGWKAGFADLPANGADYQLAAGIRPLPASVGSTRTGFFITGNNHSDDLFMFLQRRLTREDGIQPGQAYRVSFTIEFASDAPSGSIGIGGSPGESVYLKAGAAGVEPRAVNRDGELRMNVDKGNQAVGGPAASVVGNIANGLDEPTYVLLRRRHTHTRTIRADAHGRIWLLVGTDSGFEGKTALYFKNITATLKPVK